MEPVPITPSVLQWAVAESGLSIDAVASAAGVTRAEFDSWLSGSALPSATQLRAVARRLHRQLAVFLLPRPPLEAPLRIQFRHPIGGRRGAALPEVERRFIRRARRLQDAERWLAAELGRGVPEIAHEPFSSMPAAVADVWRRRLGVTLEAQISWNSPLEALDGWQRAIESAGVTVMRFPMGPESCRGFCLWDPQASVIALNDAWTEEACLVTLFHQLAHLVTRTDSACAAAPVTAHSDALERWCELFAAALLIPPEAIAAIELVERLADAASLARQLKVSLRAMTLRLVEQGKASWALYERIPGGSDAKRTGNDGGGASRRVVVRRFEFGSRTADVFVTAVRRGLISMSQALDYLDIASADFERLAARSAA